MRPAYKWDDVRVDCKRFEDSITDKIANIEFNIMSVEEKNYVFN